MSVTNNSVKSKIFLATFWLAFIYCIFYPFVFEKSSLPAPETVLDRSVDIPDFSAITDIKEKKRAFFSYLLPEIHRQNELVMQERLFVLSVEQKIQSQNVITDVNRQRLLEMAKKYKLDPNDQLDVLVTSLLRRVDIIPPALVLVQAANESAWGTSRFARNGYNFFGLWCFQKGCGFVPRQRKDGLGHEVAKFSNLSQAVNTYVRNLNRHYAYEELRNIRYTLRSNQQKITAEALVHGLMSYSERGQDYIDELLNMIRYNKKYMQV